MMPGILNVIGVPRDKRLAEFWFERASERGVPK
jgi:TPR repeat protein